MAGAAAGAGWVAVSGGDFDAQQPAQPQPLFRPGDPVLVTPDDPDGTDQRGEVVGDTGGAARRVRLGAAEREVPSGRLRFVDPDFPPDARSIDGSAAVASREAAARATQCRCGVNAEERTVQRDTPNRGRKYYSCRHRVCGFFQWADTGSAAHFRWFRMPGYVVVSQYGFNAADLRQGEIGDCWFLSALAVIAERPDLVMQLLPETRRSAAGRQWVRLFMDGHWQRVAIDELLPCTRSQRRPDGSGLCYSRADGQQLWVPFIEKAYAKSYGSYKAISGGEIEEALLDLTGAPTESIDFAADGFDPSLLWERLLRFRAQGFPMGCATAPIRGLREVGLVGLHAYSILDVRELSRGRHQLLKLRNPHSSWAEALRAEVGEPPQGADGGTFWIDFMTFLQGFQLVDVCKALPAGQWSARSFPNEFPAKQAACRLCRDAYHVDPGRAGLRLWVMALQPSRRGRWCRTDRKKSYQLGDVTILAFEQDPAAPGGLGRLVGGSLCGGRRDVHAELELAPGRPAVVLALCTGPGPAAAGGAGERLSAAPFVIRLYGDGEFRVRAAPSAPYAPEVPAALNRAYVELRGGPGCSFRRNVYPFGPTAAVAVVKGDGAVSMFAVNAGSAPLTVRVRAAVKCMGARAESGLLRPAPPQPAVASPAGDGG
eukprot:TRINITY_DN1103_c1_g1_i1.p2 TRINITY_DN1103_c1_g1~~TRINITY_DN1103_c1_g1_i1.p2  ORF type:complete len:677 (+),score=235.07 TRINITY_DN1103_c1_g1_i1:65-2032(+)